MGEVTTRAGDFVMEIQGAGKRLGERQALDGLGLSLRPCEAFALLGPNGAGKATTVNLILGFLKADAGTVRVCWIDAGADPVGARRHVAYIPEQVALYPSLSGSENLRYVTTLAEAPGDQPPRSRRVRRRSAGELPRCRARPYPGGGGLEPATGDPVARVRPGTRAGDGGGNRRGAPFRLSGGGRRLSPGPACVLRASHSRPSPRSGPGVSGLPCAARPCRLGRRSGLRTLRPARSGRTPGGGDSRLPDGANPAPCRPDLPSSFAMAGLMHPNRNNASEDASPVAIQPRDVSAARVRRGKEGRGVSSARARRDVLDLMPIIDAMRGEVGRTLQCLALELTRRGGCKPRGGAVWTPVDIGRLLHKIGTERAR